MKPVMKTNKKQLKKPKVPQQQNPLYKFIHCVPLQFGCNPSVVICLAIFWLNTCFGTYENIRIMLQG